jgi:anaerobic selenocysteine-containing dehydrogenase
MLVLGANPSVSNGWLMTAPGVRHRLRAIVARGGTVVVVDPRRAETAAHASEHVAIAPGGDPYLPLGMPHVLFAEGRTRLGHLEGHADGIATTEALAGDWPVARTVAALPGIIAAIRRHVIRLVAVSQRVADDPPPGQSPSVPPGTSDAASCPASSYGPGGPDIDADRRPTRL